LSHRIKMTTRRGDLDYLGLGVNPAVEKLLKKRGMFDDMSLSLTVV